jgi:hypothetical protein
MYYRCRCYVASHVRKAIGLTENRGRTTGSQVDGCWYGIVRWSSKSMVGEEVKMQRLEERKT